MAHKLLISVIKKGMMIMKTVKLTKRLMVLAMLLALAAVLGVPGTAQAKAKTYKAKTVKVTEGKSKTVKTSKKIKSVKISSKNKNFTVKKTAGKKFKVSGTDAGKTQAVKVTYTNKYTQTFKIKTKKPAAQGTYKKKVIAELKSLMADPDKGLRKALADWESVIKKPTDTDKYQYVTTFQLRHLSSKIEKKFTVDEVMNEFTSSEKKGLILQAYCRAHMTYDSAYVNSYASALYGGMTEAQKEKQFEKLYSRTFRGVCGDSAMMCYDIARELDMTARATGNVKEYNHGWCNIRVTDKAGNGYWMGIYANSAAFNLKGEAQPPQGWTLTKKQRDKWLCKPNEQTRWYPMTAPVKKPSATQAPAPTARPAVTQAPAPQPVKTPAPVPTATPFNPEDIPPTRTLPPELLETPEPVETQAPSAEPTGEPVIEPTMEPTAEPTESPEPEPTVAPAPAPTVEPAVTPEPGTDPEPEQRIVIPYAEHNYTCPGCNPLNPPPCRHTDSSKPYVTNSRASYGGLTVYKHVIGTEVRYFDENWNEYIDVNGSGSIADELVTLAG